MSMTPEKSQAMSASFAFATVNMTMNEKESHVTSYILLKLDHFCCCNMSFFLLPLRSEA
jgi:hypothetical protein